MRDVHGMRLVYYIFKKNKINNNNNLISLFSIHSNLRFKHLSQKKIVDLMVKICELVYKDRIIQRKNNQYNIET